MNLKEEYKKGMELLQNKEKDLRQIIQNKNKELRIK